MMRNPGSTLPLAEINQRFFGIARPARQPAVALLSRRIDLARIGRENPQQALFDFPATFTLVDDLSSSRRPHG
jgi:hypothetical protein